MKGLELPELCRDPIFRRRRFLNWFPLGVAYALLYMGRYNFTVAKTALGDAMTKADFGWVSAVGTVIYGLSFLYNGPLVDRIGGRKGMLIALSGAAFFNGMFALYLFTQLGASEGLNVGLMSLLYGANMYFQSFAAVSIVKVNAHWFHVRERGGFSGIFGTMISSGIFFAFTGNFLVLDLLQIFFPGQRMEWVVFGAPALLLALILVVEFALLRNDPGAAGFKDFDTADASSGDESDLSALQLMKKIFTNPIIMTVAVVEFCTGILRNGVMHWFPVYAREVWGLAAAHPLRYGPIRNVVLNPFARLLCDSQNAESMLCNAPFSAESSYWFSYFAGGIGVGIILFLLGLRRTQRRGRIALILVGAFIFLAAFFPMGWGGLLFVAGVTGGNFAGWVSDKVFQSRRGPSALFLYALLFLCCLVMPFGMFDATNIVSRAAYDNQLLPGDRITHVFQHEVRNASQFETRFQCVPMRCPSKSEWSGEQCMCVESTGGRVTQPRVYPQLELTVERKGESLTIQIRDPSWKAKVQSLRQSKISFELPKSPWILGLIIFMMSLCVIGTHGLLSGTATMDFGGRKGAATAVGIIDGFVYLGTALQFMVLGQLTEMSWDYWPMFLAPFALIGAILLGFIWKARPNSNS